MNIHKSNSKYRAILPMAIVVVIVAGAFLLWPRGGEEVSGIVSVSGSSSADSGAIREYDYTEAPKHIGERAVVKGAVVKTFTAKSGVTFFDFCTGIDSCPFSAVIFASDLNKFGDLSQYARTVKITGVIKSYQGKAEMVLNSPDQIE